MCCVCVYVWVCLNGIWFLLISSTGICCLVAASLLLVNLNRVPLLHFQWGWCIVLIDRLSVESKSHDLHGKSLQKGYEMIYVYIVICMKSWQILSYCECHLPLGHNKHSSVCATACVFWFWTGRQHYPDPRPSS